MRLNFPLQLHNTISLAFVALMSASLPVKAAEKGPVVVELFTSQGCYSCPPAEAYLGKLAKRSDVIALEFHVDYWDDLVYGAAGKWKDPFSSPANTQRQRQYNTQIRRTAGVYTPQMVIGGQLEAVGSQTGNVEAAISRIAQSGAGPLSVRITPGADGNLNVRIDGQARRAASVWLVSFHRDITTQVRSGENKGKTLTSHNIVSNLQRIGDWRSAPMALTAPMPETGQGCAVLVQNAATGPVLGAAYCPVTPSS